MPRPLPTYDAPSGGLTAAEWIAHRFHNDGLCFTIETPDGAVVPLSDAVTGAAVRVYHLGSSGDIHEFSDGSCIAVTDYGWDVVTVYDGGWVSVDHSGHPDVRGWRFEFPADVDPSA